MEERELFDRFYQVIDDMIVLFDELKGFEEKKLGAVVGNDVLRLESLMNEEQAYLLKMRGLDQKREKIQKEMGMEGKTFRQMIEAAPEEQKEIMKGLKEVLDQKAKVLQEAVGKTKVSIESHLQRLDRMMQNVEKDSRGYNKTGARESKTPTATRFKPTRA